MEETWAKDMLRLLSSTTAMPTDCLQEGARLELFEFNEGTPRKVSEVFSVVTGRHVSKVVIRDPYCGLKTQRGKLKRFLTELLKLPKAVDNVEVHCREPHSNDRNYEHRLQVTAAVEDLLSECGVHGYSVVVQDSRGPVRAFHDREIEFEVVENDGTSLVYRFFLTGGIDYLMDDRSQTRVFRYQTTS